MGDTFSPAVTSPSVWGEETLWFAFCKERLLVEQNGVPTVHDLEALGLNVVRQQYLGTLGGRPCFSAELDGDAKAPEGMTFEPLRKLYNRLDERQFSLAGLAKQVVAWDSTHQFCGRCGVKTLGLPNERAKRCPQCRLVNFPRLSPAIIVSIERGNTLLLARANHFSTHLYSVLAGFVEPGETLEQAVEREVHEEVDLRIKNVRYFGSQPWPFPNSLMVAFTAEYAAGTIQIDRKEISEARWFTVSDLPQIPDKISIARRLIDHFVENQRAKRKLGEHY